MCLHVCVVWCVCVVCVCVLYVCGMNKLQGFGYLLKMIISTASLLNPRTCNTVCVCVCECECESLCVWGWGGGGFMR